MRYTAANIEEDMIAVVRDEPDFVGTGEFAGWYSSEKLVDVDVIGCVIYTDDSILATLHKVPIHKDDMYIESIYQSARFDAKDDNDALDKVVHAIQKANETEYYWHSFIQ